MFCTFAARHLDVILTYALKLPAGYRYFLRGECGLWDIIRFGRRSQWSSRGCVLLVQERALLRIPLIRNGVSLQISFTQGSAAVSLGIKLSFVRLTLPNVLILSPLNHRSSGQVHQQSPGST